MCEFWCWACAFTEGLDHVARSHYQLADFVLDELDFSYDYFAVGSIQKPVDYGVHYTVDGDENIRNFGLGCTRVKNLEETTSLGRIKFKLLNSINLNQVTEILPNFHLFDHEHPTSVRMKQNLSFGG